VADLADSAIDEIEHRLRGADERSRREFEQLFCGIFAAQHIDVPGRRETWRAAPAAARLEVLRLVPWKRKIACL